MKPRRENGATLVSPMKSDVIMGSALMVGVSSGLGGSGIEPPIPGEGKSPACENGPIAVGTQFRTRKKQGRRRSITPTALPTPDIEIGSRHPVHANMPGNRTLECDPLHNGQKGRR
jgi:hypothetical protein